MAFRWEQVLTKIVLAVIVGFIFVIASVVTYAVVTDLIGEKRPEQVEEDFFVDLTLNEPCQCGVKINQNPRLAVQISNPSLIGSTKIDHKIFGGQEAKVNSIPWQVGIKVYGTFPFCGGTIVGPTTVLTAAHCVDNINNSPRNVKIIVSEHDHSIANESISMEMAVREVIMHPKYDRSKILYDFAVLRTNEMIPFSETANAACLPNSSSGRVVSDSLQISGWGKAGRDQFGAFEDTIVLKTATIKSYSSVDCCKFTEDDFKCLTKTVVFDDSVICAGSTSQRVGVCFGDSGGPLVHFNGTHSILIGITSYVVGSCGTLGVVDGFANVVHEMKWIRQHSDNYVKLCSARLDPSMVCETASDCVRSNEICDNGQCICNYGFLRRDSDGTCINECELMNEFNRCSGGTFQAQMNGWSKNITIDNGGYNQTDWCFCHFHLHRDAYFKVTYHTFKGDLGDEMLWYSSYKKMPSKLEDSTRNSLPVTFSFRSYSTVLQGQWISSSFQLLFQGVNITIEALI